VPRAAGPSLLTFAPHHRQGRLGSYQATLKERELLTPCARPLTANLVSER
jgi:hypothetical protein